MAELTFRDFAAAIMKGDVDGAAAVLQPLLGLDAVAARAAAHHFHAQSAAVGPPFMAKAMGLRTAIAGGSDTEVEALLRDCFGLVDAPLATAVATLRPRPG
jgi:hypothetical protein